MPYTIQPGDTLSAIATRNGVSVNQLIALNPEFNTARYNYGNRIFAGGSVKLPSDNQSSTGGFTPIPLPGSAGFTVRPTTPDQVRPPVINPSPFGGGGTTPADPLLAQLEGLPGQQRDAYAALKTLFDSYGLGSLAPTILRYLQDGFGADTITVLLQQTPEYKARFAGNTARQANGLQVLTPAEYLSTEASYKQLLRANGMDPHFSTQSQFSEWIGNDVSPQELSSRVSMAVQATTMAPPTVTQYLNQLGINTGDMASYFLNDKNPTPQLQLKLNQAQIGGAALQNKLQVSAADSQRFAQMGVTYQQAQSAYQRIADILPAAQRLTQIYKSQAPVNQGTLQEEFLGSSGAAQLARERLSQQEEAAFSGTSGVGKSSFQQQVSGAQSF